jgi:flap endonuclease GEN
MDVHVVFVLEGRAPELKYKTIAARNAVQFKGAKPKTDTVKVGKDRSRFNHTLKQCEEMLKLMGIACVKGEGEAEALCAYLNEDGVGESF